MPNKNWIIILNSFIFLIFISVGCTGDQRTESIQKYNGDGKITYLATPTLGKSGVLIQMMPIDLSLGQNKMYNLCEIPKGDNYIIYLVIEEENFERQLIRGIWTIRLKLNKRTIVNVSSALQRAIELQSRGIKKYYFDLEGSFDIRKTSCDCSLEVGWEITDPPPVPVKAHIEISRGGSK